MCVDPITSVAPYTAPAPKSWTMYIGRSATMGWLLVTLTETPGMPGPTPRVGSKTWMVALDWAGMLVVLVTGPPLLRKYWSVTLAVELPGFCRVRYSLNPARVLPSAKYHTVLGALAPKASWPSGMAPEPQLNPFTYIGRSTTMLPPVDVTLTETPPMPMPTPQVPAVGLQL